MLLLFHIVTSNLYLKADSHELEHTTLISANQHRPGRGVQWPW